MSTKNNAFCLTAQDFKGAIAFYAYSQCPNRQPRNIDKVMDAVENIIKTEFKSMGDFRYLNFENDFYNYIKEKLMSIPEFVDWNLSQSEKDKGISVDNPTRPQFTFVSRYDKTDENSWYTDFVDLDAFIQNVHRHILMMQGD